MHCELSKPHAEVKWFKGDKEITMTKNVQMTADGKKRMLIIKKAEKTDLGEYTCDCGSDKTTAKLTIEGTGWAVSHGFKLSIVHF